MKMIFNIARNELRQLFCSPIAWILLVIFYVQTGITFADAVNGLIRYNSLGFGLQEITSQIFRNAWTGIYPAALSWLYLYVPLLTMGLISREKTSGTDRLLLSSPVSEVQIVLGKFLSMMICGLVMLSSLIIQIVFCSVTVHNLDFGPVLSGFLGLYLLFLAYSAIGIFMSSLTGYQIIAAVGTIAVLFGLNRLTVVGQEIPVLREITYWLGISGRAESFISGMICSEDLIYFLAVMGLFLCLTIMKSRNEKSRPKASKAFAQYSAAVLVVCVVGFVTSRPECKFYLDTTREKSCTLTEESRKVMEKLDGPLTITTYVNLIGPDLYTGLPKNYTRDVDRFAWYTRFKPEIKMKYVYYWHESEIYPMENKRFAGLDTEGKARKVAEIYSLKFDRFLTPDQIGDIDAKVNLKDEDYAFVRVIERGNGSMSKLRLYDDQENHPGEREITAAMKRLTGPVPKVGLVTGHGERSRSNIGEDGYYTFADSHSFRYALINQGFDVEEVDLAGGIPEDISILMISDPKTEFADCEKVLINSYVRRGGNIFIAAKPYNRAKLDFVMDSLGLRFIPGTLVQESSDYAPDFIVADIAPEAVKTGRGYADYIAKKYRTAGTGTMGIDVSGARAKGFLTYNVLTTDSLSCDTTRVWNELQVVDFEDEKPSFNPETGEKLQNRTPVLAALERKVGDKDQHIIVLGNADMIANGELMRNRAGISASNYSIIMESFRYLSNGEFPVYAARPAGTDNELRFIDRYSKKPVKLVFKFYLPLLMALAGIFILLRRRWR